MDWGSIAVSILSGAGGAALLDLWWKPRRDRRRVSSLLLAEILINTDYLLLQAHARVNDPKSIPADFKLSVKAWEKAGDRVSELDPDLVKRLLLLYIRYSDLNNYVSMFNQLLYQQDAFSATDPRRKVLERNLAAIIDNFNTGIDKAIESGKSISTSLLHVVRIKIPKTSKGPTRDYASDVERFMSDREERIQWLQSLKGK